MTNINPKLDLKFERVVSLQPDQLWKGWTDPDTLMKWFCPRPWKVVACTIDLRSGGEFATTMQSPEGQNFPNSGCFLEVIPNRKLVWTNALLPDFRPAVIKDDTLGFAFSATIEFTPMSGGTKYTAIVRHGDEASCQKHAAMGFQEGWGIALDQLIELYKK